MTLFSEIIFLGFSVVSIAFTEIHGRVATAEKIQPSQ